MTENLHDINVRYAQLLVKLNLPMDKSGVLKAYTVALSQALALACAMASTSCA